jgi:hypothetical protein
MSPPSLDAVLPGIGAVARGSDRRTLARRARLLSWASLGWMTIEGAVAVTAGIAAGSIALVGFGIDSAIEGIASVIIIWRFAEGRMLSDAAERRAQQLVAVSFFLLAPYVAIEAVQQLAAGNHPETSWVGIGLSISSLIVMPWLGVAKARIGNALGSAATVGEGRQNVLCAYLASAVLVGLAGNALFGLWWLDPAAALVIAAVAVKEGREAWRGEGCCVPHADAGATPPDACDGECREPRPPEWRLVLLGRVAGRRRLASDDTLDDPPLRALEVLDLEPRGPQVLEWLTHQVVALKPNRQRIKRTLHGADRQHGTADVLEGHIATARTQNPVSFGDGSPGIGNRAQRERADDGVVALVWKVEGLSIAKTHIGVATELGSTLACQLEHLGAELDRRELRPLRIEGQIATAADSDLQNVALRL